MNGGAHIEQLQDEVGILGWDERRQLLLDFMHHNTTREKDEYLGSRNRILLKDIPGKEPQHLGLALPSEGVRP